MTDIDAIKDLLSHLEEEHTSGKISDGTYKELKSNYEMKLNSVRQMPRLPQTDDRPMREDLEELRAKLERLTAESTRIDSKVHKNYTRPMPEPQPVEEDQLAEKLDPMKLHELSALKRLFKKVKEPEPVAKEKHGFLSFLHHEKQQPDIAPAPDEDVTQAAEQEADKLSGEAQAEVAPPVQPEAAAEQPVGNEEPSPESKPEVQQVKQEGEERKGLLSKLFHHEPKPEKEQAPPMPQPEPPPAVEQAVAQPVTTDESGSGDAGAAVANMGVELEKVKVILDTVRETKKATDETLSNIFESIGEIRSMSFQTDASLKELTAKLERTEDEVGDINPKIFTKKLNDINEFIERHNMILEKLDAKTNDLTEKINQNYNMLKTIGNIENLATINKDMQRKISDINEVTKYIERISVKAEKTYIDLNDRMGDFMLYRSKQEGLDDTVKDIIKTLERLNTSLEAYAQKKDLDGMNQSIVLMQNEIQELNKTLPIVQMKVPDNIMTLKTEKEDIMLLLASLKGEVDKGKIAQREYDRIRSKNEHKLNEIDHQLKKEWTKLQRVAPHLSAGAAPPQEEKQEAAPTPAPMPAVTQAPAPAAPAPSATPAKTPAAPAPAKPAAPAAMPEAVMPPEKRKRGRPRKEVNPEDELPKEKPKRKNKKKMSYEDNDFTAEVQQMQAAAEGKAPPKPVTPAPGAKPAAPAAVKPVTPAAGAPPAKDEKKDKDKKMEVKA